MIYSFTILTPKNTPETDKQKTTLKLTKGIIHQIDIMFPSGPRRVMRLHINDALHQVWPSNPEASFGSDNETISFREHVEISREPYSLTAYTWNTSTKWDHTIVIRLGLLKRQFILRRIF